MYSRVGFFPITCRKYDNTNSNSRSSVINSAFMVFIFVVFVLQGLKAACHKFQLAAGIFQHIRENVVKGLVGTLTQDLIHDGLNAASMLMLAQASWNRYTALYIYWSSSVCFCTVLYCTDVLKKICCY